jgi:hypothetical protein
MARAEKLDQKWSDEEALRNTRPHAYCSDNQELRTPVTVMGEFVVYRDPWYRRSYQWVSRHDVTGKNVVFEYPMTDDFTDALNYIDHETGTFYLIFRFRAAQEAM